MNTATFGDLSHIVNLETETICIKFESITDSQKFRQCMTTIRKPQSKFN